MCRGDPLGTIGAVRISNNKHTESHFCTSPAGTQFKLSNDIIRREPRVFLDAHPREQSSGISLLSRKPSEALGAYHRTPQAGRTLASE